jgi:hypothetical protein
VEPAPPRPSGEADVAERRMTALYVRLAVGMGFPFGPDVADVYDGRDGEALQFSGVSFAMDWMGGLAVLPGLHLGLGAASDAVLGGTVREPDQTERDLENSLYYAVVGGFADFYLEPPAGLHFQALLGLARLSRSDDLGQNTATGFGAVLGIGYELAVGRRWNVGALARMAISPLGMDAVDGAEPSPTLFEPSLLVSATFRPEAERP